MNRKVLLVGLSIVAPLLIVLFIGLGHDPHQIDSPLIGKIAPTFTLPPVDGGKPIALASLRGRPVVINFWATWCEPCFAEHPALVAGGRELADQAHFLGIVFDDDSDNVTAFLRQQGSSYPSLQDEGGKVAMAYGVYGVPETFFLNAQGIIVAKHVGPLTPEDLRAYVARAAASPGGNS
jgi:cytochrome c biogenesis protein CcmG/thiol:disulfide interchange protein DsbE